MTRLPRDLSGEALVRALSRLGFAPTRQTGSHMRLTTQEGGEHHVTVPRHDPLRVGTLGGILAEVAAHFETSRDDVIERLFG
jgi:predicted RNA binding protein YcfA (HicA-like mRNA interferase family)